jgi:hypothetical protein
MSHIFAYNNGIGMFYNERINKTDKHAFSGDYAHANKEEFMKEKNKGPIPIGSYTINSIDKSESMVYLTPDEGNEMFDREEMMLHLGNSIVNHNSQGCIITTVEIFKNLEVNDTIEVTNELYKKI